MRLWRRETRESSSYTDAVVAVLADQAAGGTNALPSATGALEACSGLVGRAFASVEVKNAPEAVTAALTPEALRLIGRSLIRTGEQLLAVEVRGGRVHLIPVASHNVTGDYMPDSWRYMLELPGPTKTAKRTNVAADSVLHFRYAVDPNQPWLGIGPLTVAKLAGRLSAETAKALADEASGPRGHLLPIPQKDGKDATVAQLREDLKKLRGKTALVESLKTWTGDPNSAGADNWQAKRLGFDAPDTLAGLLAKSTAEVYAAIGISSAIFGDGDGTAKRESYRHFLHSVASPLGRIVETELRAKLDAPDLTLSFDSLYAADLSGRARAFQSMVGGGMEIEKAATLAGLMEAE